MMTKPQIGMIAAAALGLITVGSYLMLSDGDVGELEHVEVLPEEEEPVIRFPIPESQPPEEMAAQEEVPAEVRRAPEQQEPVPFSVSVKIPLLAESDETLLSVLSQLFDLDKFSALFQVKSMITRLVTTVDNMTLRTLPSKHALIQPPKGKFPVIERENYEFTLDPKNYKRYTRYVDFIEQVGVKDAVTVYVHFYPLFQEVYETLGYPDSYFNDRLIEVIDHLMETPEVDDPIYLQRPHVFYIYEDKEIEALSAGQRTLIRMGTDNARRLKVVLLNLRSEIMARVKRN